MSECSYDFQYATDEAHIHPEKKINLRTVLITRVWLVFKRKRDPPLWPAAELVINQHRAHDVWLYVSEILRARDAKNLLLNCTAAVS